MNRRLVRCSPRCLTLPSRGRPQAGFAHLRPPLMSNVRLRKNARTSLCCIERESVAMSSCSFAIFERSQVGCGQKQALVAVCAFRQVSARSDDRSNSQSAAALQAPPRVNVGQFVGAGAVAPARSGQSRSQWFRLRRSGLVVAASSTSASAAPRPNPSVNRTSNSGLRPLSAAGYLKR